MNNVIIKTLFLLILASHVTGQNTYLTSEKDHFYFGVSGGIGVIGIVNQNNYGFREMDYEVPLGASMGFTAGKEWLRKHRVEVSIQFASAGQSYYTKNQGVNDSKEVRMTMVQIPVVYKRRVLIFHDSDTGTESLFHLGLGIQPTFLTTSKVDWRVDENEVSMGSFLSRRSNDNSDDLVRLLGEDGRPASDSDLFNKLDLQAILTAGYIYKASLKWMLEIEVRGVYGLLDINNEAWRFPNRQGEYGSSHHISGGLRLSAYYTLWN